MLYHSKSVHLILMLACVCNSLVLNLAHASDTSKTNTSETKQLWSVLAHDDGCIPAQFIYDMIKDDDVNHFDKVAISKAMTITEFATSVQGETPVFMKIPVNTGGYVPAWTIRLLAREGEDDTQLLVLSTNNCKRLIAGSR